jgi:hypothetical protein
MENLVSDVKGVFAEQRLKYGERVCVWRCQEVQQLYEFMTAIYSGKILNDKV